MVTIFRSILCHLANIVRIYFQLVVRDAKEFRNIPGFLLQPSNKFMNSNPADPRRQYQGATIV